MSDYESPTKFMKDRIAEKISLDVQNFETKFKYLKKHVFTTKNIKCELNELWSIKDKNRCLYINSYITFN